MSVPNTFSSGTTIASADVNANFTDFASEITGSLPRDGQAAMTGQMKAASGTVAAPAITFGSDTDTGFYRKAADTIGIVAAGAEVGTIGTSGMTDPSGLAVVGLPTGLGPLPWSATTAPAGWVRCNGRTIGNASSSATERANADTASLFTHLWTNYSDSVCAVSSGRGASAAADYAANKAIALPDLRGRSFFGLDDMGSTSAGRLGSVITDDTTNGASGGTETVTLTAGQMPSHTHTGTTSSETVSISDAHRSSTNSAAGGGGFEANIGETTDSRTSTSHTHTFTTASAGSGQAHSNMPPAFLGTWIMKL